MNDQLKKKIVRLNSSLLCTEKTFNNIIMIDLLQSLRGMRIPNSIWTHQHLLEDIDFQDLSLQTAYHFLFMHQHLIDLQNLIDSTIPSPTSSSPLHPSSLTAPESSWSHFQPFYENKIDRQFQFKSQNRCNDSYFSDHQCFSSAIDRIICAVFHFLIYIILLNPPFHFQNDGSILEYFVVCITLSCWRTFTSLPDRVPKILVHLKTWLTISQPFLSLTIME